MSDKNFNPNARYDNGPNAAGSGRASDQVRLQAATTTGLNADGTLGAANLAPGQHVAGATRNNTGPNIAGSPKSILINVAGADAQHSVGIA